MKSTETTDNFIETTIDNFDEIGDDNKITITFNLPDDINEKKNLKIKLFLENQGIKYGNLHYKDEKFLDFNLSFFVNINEE